MAIDDPSNSVGSRLLAHGTGFKTVRKIPAPCARNPITFYFFTFAGVPVFPPKATTADLARRRFYNEIKLLRMEWGLRLL